MQNKNNIYLIGIGGIGMSALARYFNSKSYTVYGYDRFRSPLCEKLEQEGINIHYTDDTTNIPQSFKAQDTIVIYTPAIASDNALFTYFEKAKYNIYKRAQILGLIAKNHKCLAVAGTHGKTTTSALLAHLFHNAGIKAHAFLGGIAVNYQTNYLQGDNNTELLITEADEFDRSFLQLHPEGAIITSTDADHLDIYSDSADFEKTFVDFSKNISENPIIEEHLHIEGIKYGFHSESAYYATNIRIEAHHYQFDLVSPMGTINQIKTGLPGRHNIENAVGAAALGLLYGLTLENIKSGIETFKGVKRRFEYHIKTENMVYIDDYAHHPTEINALLQSVKELYPNKKITGIFQPHLYSRTRDFADGFAHSLSQLDELILMDIYPAREKPLPGVNAAMLLNKIDIENKSICSTQEILSHFRENKKELVLTIGAGDIDQLINPLKMVLLNG